MKKKIVLTILILLVLSICCACVKEPPKEIIEKAINIKIKGADVEKHINKAWVGDGIDYIVLKKIDSGFLEIIKNSSEWSESPSSIVKAILYGGEYQGEWTGGPMLMDDNDKVLIPKIKHAYYYYKNRFEYTDNDDELTELEKKTKNFTVAVYDIDNKKLYYCEFDS